MKLQSSRPGFPLYRLTPERISKLTLIILLLVVWAIIIVHRPSYPQQYQYKKLTAINGVELHTIQTRPNNIRLQAIDTNVIRTSYYGINGGFFWEGALLSIAVINDQPLKGVQGDYGSGWYNTGINTNLQRGTLVWDEQSKRFSVQVVTHAGELKIMDKKHYWAQGGVSMSLHNEANWRLNMIAEEMPSYDTGHMRTGMVYDQQQNVYLIVTPTLCTIEQFRTAILDQLGGKGIVDGIFLDGDGSSQLQSREARLYGDHRQVFQMLTLKH
ncbi:hypothetical protein D3C73_1028870 [compost metagenome]